MAVFAAGLVVWQAWQLAELQGRIAVLEELSALQLSSDPNASGSPSAERLAEAARAVQAVQSKAASDGLTEAQTEALVQEALSASLEQTLDAREERKREEQTERWVEMATESMSVEIEALGEEHDLTPEVQERTLSLLVDATREAVALRRAVQDGDLGVREAKEDGRLLESDLVAELDELLGEELIDEVGRRIRPERPWDRGK